MKKHFKKGIVTALTVIMTMGGVMTSCADQWIFDGPESWKSGTSKMMVQDTQTVGNK